MEKYIWSDQPSSVAFPVDRAGYAFIFAAAFVTAVMALLNMTIPALIGLVATFFICYFFRDPDRVVPHQDGAIVSPADGKVIVVEKMAASPYYEGACTKISIFMSIFNVHVNRIPHAGGVKRISYYPGKFFRPTWIKHLKRTSITRYGSRPKTAGKSVSFRSPD